MSLTSRILTRIRPGRLPTGHGAEYRSAIIRVPADLVPPIDLEGDHVVYPAASVHVTVGKLDGADVAVDVAVARLKNRRLPAPTFTGCGLGYSPTTLFLALIHDHRFAVLQDEIEDAFETHATIRTRLRRRISVANVARFSGFGRITPRADIKFIFTATEMEIVETDRFLSPEETTVIARVPLQN